MYNVYILECKFLNIWRISAMSYNASSRLCINTLVYTYIIIYLMNYLVDNVFS